MATGCIVIKDRFGDCHATKMPVVEEANVAAMQRWAAELAENIGFEPGERYTYGVTSQRDPGAARLLDGVAFENGGIEWDDETITVPGCDCGSCHDHTADQAY